MRLKISAKIFKTIKFRLVFVFTLIILAGCVFMAYSMYDKTRDKINDFVKENFELNLRAIATQVSLERNQQFLMVEKLSQLPNISNPDISFEEKCRFLRTIAEKDDRYTQITFFDAEGNNFTELGTYRSSKDSKFFIECMSGVKEFINDPFNNPVTNRLSVYYASPVYSPENKIIGVILVIMDGDALCKIAQGITIGQSSHPMIINNKTGVVVGESGEDMVRSGVKMKTDAVGEFKDVINDACAGGSGFKTILDNHGAGKPVKTICCYMPVAGTDWSVITTAPCDEFYGELKNMSRIARNISLICFIFVMVVALILIRRLLRPLQDVDGAIHEIASGHADLTKRLEVKTEDEVGSVSLGFNLFVQKLHDIISALKAQEGNLDNAGTELEGAAEETASSVTEILSNIDSMGNQITNQAASVEETSGTINEIASNISSLDKMIEEQVMSVSQASAAVEQMIGNISSVNKNVENMAGSFDSLIKDTQSGMQKQDDVNDRIRQIEEQSVMLAEANQAIAAIAEQTNLLAMNAAIEAAHAGEAGKGFSVVADEIRKLSETSGAQSKSIGEQLNNIRESIETVVVASKDTRNAFDSVSKKIEQTDNLVQQIKSAMAEQQEGSKQIGESLHSMNDSALNVRNAAEEMTEGSKAIVEEMDRLRDETMMMKNSMDEMSAGAKSINKTAVTLNEVVGIVKDVMGKIKGEIGQFTV